MNSNAACYHRLHRSNGAGFFSLLCFHCHESLCYNEEEKKGLFYDWFIEDRENKHIHTLITIGGSQKANGKFFEDANCTLEALVGIRQRKERKKKEDKFLASNKCGELKIEFTSLAEILLVLVVLLP
jgi:hypothetical protein